MRIGGENRNQLIILGLLAVIAAFALPRMFSGSPQAAAPQPNAPATTTKTTATLAARTGKKAPPRRQLLAQSLDPSLRFDLLKQGEGQQYEGSKRNIFESHPVDIPKPIDPGIKPGPQTPAPPVVPVPPPIPLKFYGFATQPGQAKRVFLASTNSDDVFVGSEGQVINRRYRIVKVNNTSVDVEDILNNNRQTIPLTPQT